MDVNDAAPVSKPFSIVELLLCCHTYDPRFADIRTAAINHSFFFLPPLPPPPKLRLIVMGTLKSMSPMQNWNCRITSYQQHSTQHTHHKTVLTPLKLLQQMTVCWQFTLPFMQFCPPLPSGEQQYGTPLEH